MKSFIILCAIIGGLCLLINFFKRDNSYISAPPDAYIEHPESSIF